MSLLVARRSVTAATVTAPLVAVLSVAAGVLAGARTMLFDEDRHQVLLWMVAATLPVSLAVGVALATRVRAVDNERLRHEARRREAAEAERVRREVVASLSHDLRTPLAGIRAMAEALEDGVADDPPDYLRRILRETARTSEMVDDLLALTSLHAGAARTSLDDVDVRDLVSDTLASMGPTAKALGVSLDGRAEGDIVVRGDTRQLSRALLNLVVNGLQHTPAGGAVRIEARRCGAVVLVDVTDGCGGIHPADLARVFSPGWRGAEGRPPARGPVRSPGAGLGLAIVRSIADAHEGTVCVANASTRGCRFTLRLPARGEEPSRPGPEGP